MKRQIERAREAGYTVKAGSKLESYLIKSYDQVAQKRRHDLQPSPTCGSPRPAGDWSRVYARLVATRVYRPMLTPLATFLSRAVPLLAGLVTLVRSGFGAAVGVEAFFGLPVGLFLWRLSVVRLEVDEGGIVSHGPLKTRRLPWSDIDRLELGEGSSYANAVMRDGSLVGLPAVQATQLSWLLGRRSHAADIVDELNRLRPDSS